MKLVTFLFGFILVPFCTSQLHGVDQNLRLLGNVTGEEMKVEMQHTFDDIRLITANLANVSSCKYLLKVGTEIGRFGASVGLQSDAQHFLHSLQLMTFEFNSEVVACLAKDLRKGIATANFLVLKLLEKVHTGKPGTNSSLLSKLLHFFGQKKVSKTRYTLKKSDIKSIVMLYFRALSKFGLLELPGVQPAMKHLLSRLLSISDLLEIMKGPTPLIESEQNRQIALLKELLQFGMNVKTYMGHAFGLLLANNHKYDQWTIYEHQQVIHHYHAKVPLPYNMSVVHVEVLNASDDFVLRVNDLICPFLFPNRTSAPFLNQASSTICSVPVPLSDMTLHIDYYAFDHLMTWMPVIWVHGAYSFYDVARKEHEGVLLQELAPRLCDQEVDCLLPLTAVSSKITTD